MRIWLLVLCFFGAACFGSELRLKEKLCEAEPGSYIVTEQNKNFTLVYVRNRADSTITIEEVTIPQSRYKRKPMPWRHWFESGAPGHTSWTMSQINLSTGQFEETYSFTHQGWIDLSDSNPFLTTLLNLRFISAPDEKRRRVGLPPGYHKADNRPYWSPCLIVDGQRLSNIPFSVWVAKWPADGSELARKYIEIYIPCEVNAPSIPSYPTYFPYWIEVDGTIGCAKVRIVDSGTNAHSPKAALPLRPPELIGDGKLLDDGFAIKIKTPGYYSDFMIIAEEVDTCFGKTFSLPCKISSLDTQTVSLFIEKDVLNQLMTPGENYRFLISPKENPSLCLETRTPLEFCGL